MHPMDCGGCPVNEKPLKFGDEFLETLVEAAWNQRQNGALLFVHCALLTVSVDGSEQENY